VGYNEIILKAISNAGSVVCIDTINALTGIPKPKICERLKHLIKWKKVKISTVKKVRFYGVV